MVRRAKRPRIKKESLGRRRDKPAGLSEKVIGILKILNLIEQGKAPSAKTLAEELELSERTIYRYLYTINAIVPIVYDRELGGYRLENKKSLRIIPLEKEELALLAAIQEMLSKSSSVLKETFKGLLEKLYACTKERAEERESPIRFLLPHSVPISREKFTKIMEAVNNQKQLLIEYHSINSNETTERIIDPYGLIFHDGIWFIYAYCHLREDFRTFAIDRIKDLRSLNISFRKPEGFSLEEALRDSWHIWDDEKTEEVRVVFSPEISEIIKRKPGWHLSEKRKELPDGSLELTFRLSGLEEIKWWLYSWIPLVKVIEPERLKEEMKRDLEKSLEIFSRPD